MVGAVGAASGSARAATYGPQQTLPFTGLDYPQGVAVDPGGDVYGFTYNPDPNAVLELTAGGAVKTLPFSGLYDPSVEGPLATQYLDAPTGIAADPQGDVFVENFAAGNVLELPGNGGPQHALAVAGGLAADSAGDLFVASGNVAELAPGGTLSQVIPSPGGTGGGYRAVAVDSAGDVFAGGFDSGGNPLVVEQKPNGSPQTLPFTGLGVPDGIAVDAAGDVFVSDDAGAVEELPAGKSASVAVPFSNLGQPKGVAVDPAGDVFVAEEYNGGGSGSGANAMVELPVMRGTTTTLSSSPHLSVSGGQVTYTATVTDETSAGAETPGGSVSFAHGATAIAGCESVPLSGGKATCTVAYASPGIHAITADYGGERYSGSGVYSPFDFAASRSAPQFHLVEKAATTLAVATAVQRPLTVTYSATLTRAFDSAPLAGQRVAFSVGGLIVCRATTNASGTASCKSFGFALGGRYAALYGGDADYRATTGTGTL